MFFGRTQSSKNTSSFMTMNHQEPLEILWDALLSRDPEQVRKAFDCLSPRIQRDILAHLHRMATEPDWHPEQRISAQAALDALKNQE